MTVHHFTITRQGDKKRAPHRGNLDIQVTTQRRGRVTQPYVNEIAAHVVRVEADPTYSAPPPFKRWSVTP